MASRVKVKYKNKDVTGESVEFEIEKEDWSTYKLADGTRLRMRTIVSDIMRIDEYDEQGAPVYLVKSQNILSADVPEHLKKNAQKGDVH
ncbi:MAG: hypothetical protein BMS9Abin37_1933 [Acidobacteriota bacterium]|nr:MAG: hypothetical protein BMS9Abin37_1933 [Acidobacteriota bacterium]